MAKREPLQPSPKLQALLKEFQQIAAMSGFANHSFDPPQLRLMFTLYGRIRTETLEEAVAATPRLLAWAEALSTQLREDSSSAILPPQIQMGQPQPFTSGGYALIATLNFNTKVTDASYFKTKTAVLAAYQAAIRLREEGLKGSKPQTEPRV